MFVYPTIKMVAAELHRRAADRRGRVGWLRELLAPRNRTGCSGRRSGTPSISCCSRSSRAPSWPCRCARGQPAEGLAAERRSGGFFPALHPAGLGRLPHLELDVRQGFRHRAIRRSLRSPDGQHVSVFRTHSAVHAGGRVRHDLVAARASTSCCSSPACATSRARSTRPPSLDGAGRWPQFTPHHLAADLAGDRRSCSRSSSSFSSRFSIRSICSLERRRVDATMVMVQYILTQRHFR